MVVRTRASAGDVMAITNATLQQEIRKMSSDIGARMDAMEDGLATKIRLAVSELIADVKAELDAKLRALEARVTALEERPEAPASEDRSLNFVIYEMAESDGENVVNKVNNLVASQLSLPGIQVEAAERKHKPEGKDAGVIVVKCLNYNDKKRIMEAKSKLNTTEHFKHIRIYQDKPLWQRQHEANIRVLVKSLGSHKLFVRGSRVCERGNHQDNWINNNTGQGQRQTDGHAGAVRGGPRDNRRGARRGGGARRGNH